MTSPEITRDNERGWLIQDRDRVVTFRAKTFQALLDKLTAVAGQLVSAVLVYQLGEEVGQISFAASTSPISSETELAKAIDERFEHRGWGRCSGIEKNQYGSKTTYSIRIKENPLTYERKAMEPTCHFIRGILAAWMERYLHKKPKTAKEIRCAAVDPSECIFEFTFS